MNADGSTHSGHASRRSRWKNVGLVAIIMLAIIAFGLNFLRVHAEPILRARGIETLTARFQSKVELANFHVWVEDGLAVSGSELKIYGKTDPNIHEPG